MFMTRGEFIEWLESIGAVFYDNPDAVSTEPVYIMSKKEHQLKYTRTGRVRKNYKDLYVPYLRVSHFEGDSLHNAFYTRDNGVCAWMNVEDIKDICVGLTK